MDTFRKTTLLTIATLALAAAIPAQAAFAQYGTAGNPTTGATEEQLAECEELGIDRAQCNEHNILAKRRVQYAEKTTYGNEPEGSGTAYFAGNETWVFIGTLGAVFGGVAAAFFVKGKRTQQQ
jgi:hypothetical protein